MLRSRRFFRGSLPVAKLRIVLTVGVAAAVLCGCGYRHHTGPLKPAGQADQGTAQMQVADDGTIVFTRERLEVSLKPLADEELNRSMATVSRDGLQSGNPYTYGNWIDPETGETPQRFTVFLLKVKNYEFPKIQIDPERIHLTTDIGRTYRPLNYEDLDDYYLSYATGYAGNSHRLYERRRDVLRRTLYLPEPTFSGQEQEGYVVFPLLHHSIRVVHVHLDHVAVRFDYVGRAVEVEQLEFVFKRQVERVYPGGEPQPLDESALLGLN